MAEALSPEEQIASLRLEVAQYRAVIAELTTERDANRSDLAEAAVFKARLTTALLEIEHMKMQLAALRLSRLRFFWTPICPTGGGYGEVQHEQNHKQ